MKLRQGLRIPRTIRSTWSLLHFVDVSSSLPSSLSFNVQAHGIIGSLFFPCCSSRPDCDNDNDSHSEKRSAHTAARLVDVAQQPAYCMYLAPIQKLHTQPKVHGRSYHVPHGSLTLPVRPRCAQLGAAKAALISPERTAHRLSRHWHHHSDSTDSRLPPAEPRLPAHRSLGNKRPRRA
jgi:hypothetical protein